MGESQDLVTVGPDAGWATDPTDLDRLGAGALTVPALISAPLQDPWCDAPTFHSPREAP